MAPNIRICLKIRTLVPAQGEADFQTAGAPKEVLLECNLLVVEDLKESANAEMGPKDFFEIGYSKYACPHLMPRGHELLFATRRLLVEMTFTVTLWDSSSALRI